MPTLGVSGNIQYYDAATTAQFAGTTILVLPQFDPVYTAAFTLPIDISGSLRSAINQAQFNEVAARVDVNRVRNQIVYDVKTAFYNVLRAQAQVGVATDTLNNSLYRLEDANKNYAAGTNSRFDVLTAQRDVSDSQQALITAKSQVSVNLAALKSTIGLDVTTRIRITAEGAVETPPGVTGDVASAIPPPVKRDPNSVLAGEVTAPAAPIKLLTAPSTGVVDDDFDFGPEYDLMLKEALRNRPEVLEAEAQITAAQRGVQYARRSYMPSLSVGVNYIYTPNTNPFARAHQDVLDVNVSVPIYDGGLARERVKEAEGVIAAAKVQQRQAADQVQVDVQQAYIALVQARQRVAVSTVEMAQAQEAFRVSRVRYSAGVSQQTGVSPQLELSNAQITLAQAQSNEVNALYDYNNARAQLDRALGRYAFTGTAPGYKSSPGSSTTGQKAHG
jgi:outer membrane protein TolC